MQTTTLEQKVTYFHGEFWTEGTDYIIKAQDCIKMKNSFKFEHDCNTRNGNKIT